MTCGDVCGLRVEQLLLSTTGSSHSRGRSQCHNDVWALVTASCGYYILHWSLYYKRLAARKGGATLDARCTTHAVRTFPKYGPRAWLATFNPTNGCKLLRYGNQNISQLYIMFNIRYHNRLRFILTIYTYRVTKKFDYKILCVYQIITLPGNKLTLFVVILTFKWWRTSICYLNCNVYKKNKL